MQEKKALSSRGRGRLRGFLELRRPWGFSPEARRGSQGASRAAPGKSGLHERGEGERVIVLAKACSDSRAQNVNMAVLAFLDCSPAARAGPGIQWGPEGICLAEPNSGAQL